MTAWSTDALLPTVTVQSSPNLRHQAMTRVVFFTPPSQAELLSLSAPQLEQLLFCCREPAYDHPEAIARFWQRHFCRQPAFAAHSRLLNPLWSLWHPTSLWRLSLADPAPWAGHALEAASLTLDLSDHLPGLLQLAAVLAAVADVSDSQILLVVGDNLTRPWITGMLPYAAIPIAAAACLNSQGISCHLGSDPTAAIALLTGQAIPTESLQSDALAGWSDSQLFPALALQQPPAPLTPAASIIDLSYLREPQYFLDACVRELPGPFLVLYNQLSGLWGPVQAPEGTQVLTYTYSHAPLAAPLRQRCQAQAEAFTLQPLPALPAALQHCTHLLNQALPALLLPLVAAWHQAWEQLAQLQQACPAPAWIATTEVVSPLLLALRRGYGQGASFMSLAHSFTTESTPTVKCAQQVLVDCPLTPAFSSQSHPIAQPLAPLPRNPGARLLSGPRKYRQLLERSAFAETSGEPATAQPPAGPLRIAVFLNEECYYGYFRTDPCALSALLAAVAGHLEAAGLDYHLSLIPKTHGPVATFRAALLRQEIPNGDRITVYQRSDFSDSDPAWFQQFDINLFACHGSINLEAALCRLPTYVFLGDLTPVAFFGNYTAADLSPLFILPADLPLLGEILSPQQIRLEAERQFENALNQADLFRAGAPGLLRPSQAPAAHG